MFTPTDIRERLQTRPFVPVQFLTTTGNTYDVYHPDMVLIGRRDVIIATPRDDDPTFYEHATHLAIIHIVEMRDLPTPPSASSPQSPNGQADA